MTIFRTRFARTKVKPNLYKLAKEIPAKVEGRDLNRKRRFISTDWKTRRHRTGVDSGGNCCRRENFLRPVLVCRKGRRQLMLVLLTPRQQGEGMKRACSRVQ